MPSHRKPVPQAGGRRTPDDIGSDQRSSQHYPPVLQADSGIARYTLTDTSASTGAHYLNDSNSEEASTLLEDPAPTVEQLNGHLSQYDGTMQGYSHERSSSRQSHSSAATMVERVSLDNGHKNNETKGDATGSLQRPASGQTVYRPYEVGQSLPTINTGETLQLEGYVQEDQYLASSNPFMDGQPIVQEDVYAPYDREYGPDMYQPTYDGSYDSHVSYESQRTYEQPLAGQPYHPVPGTYGDSYYDPTLPPTTEGFYQQDPEAAYPPYPHTVHRIPRSRSPTPFDDDEDYQIMGDGSVHYTGYLPADAGRDPEKATEPYLVHDDLKTPSTVEHPLTPLETRHFGPAPSGRIHRRHKMKKRVPLKKGNLVVDLPVPPKLVLPLGGRTGEGDEMTTTRYTAVTCDPNEFAAKGFGLRQSENGRQTELFIMVTMYNEDEVLFCRTIYGVMRNIAYLCERKNSRTWGPDAWKKVVVCIVADGRKKIHPRVLDCLTLLGVYQPGDHMKNLVNNKRVTAHLFEYTTSFGLDSNLHFRYPDKKGVVPTQIIFCLKERNERKINSHRWGFNAFCRILQPNVCVLLDIGTIPSNSSIYHLWKTFDMNSNVAGACGEIAVFKGRHWGELLNPLVAAQNFEYKMSCILDKPTESMFGYISVLPGAFSAYRYIALQNDKSGQGPLNSYFKGEVLRGRDTDIFTSNMYLAEDRILCFELVAKPNSDWILKYVKGAVGETDVPDALPEFIAQRRRWLNGSFFAATYAIAHVGQILRSGHSTGRKALLMIETVYNIINLVFSWFSLGNFYLFFIVLTSSIEDPSFHLTGIKYFNFIFQYITASLVVACFLFSMGNKPQASKWKYQFTSILLALVMVYLIFCSVLCAIKAASEGGAAYRVMLLSLIVTYGTYAFSSLLAFDPWHLVTSFLPYLLLSPSYVNILNIYAFSNLDDISWGTKQDSVVETDLGAVIQDIHSRVDVEMLAEPADVNAMYEDALNNLKNRKTLASAPKASPSDAEKEQAAKDYYANVRTNLLLTWVLSNGLLLVCILGGGSASRTFSDNSTSTTKTYLLFILSFTAISNSIRLLGSTLYILTRFITG